MGELGDPLEHSAADAVVFAQYNPPPAGFWRRAVALAIDWLVLFAACWLVLFLSVHRPLADEEVTTIENLTVLIWWLYFATMESSRLQATVGKMVMGMEVVTAHGLRLSFPRATGRHFAKILSGLPAGCGFLAVVWRKNKQSFHDELAGCAVIRRRSLRAFYRPQIEAGGGFLRQHFNALLVSAVAVIAILAFALVARYQVFADKGSGVTKRLDRWTGKVTTVRETAATVRALDATPKRSVEDLRNLATPRLVSGAPGANAFMRQVAASRDRTARHYPDSAVEGSRLATRMEEIADRLEKENNEIVYSAEAPWNIAEMAAKELGIKPVR